MSEVLPTMDLPKALVPRVVRETQRSPQTCPPGHHEQGEDWDLMGSWAQTCAPPLPRAFPGIVFWFKGPLGPVACTWQRLELAEWW